MLKKPITKIGLMEWLKVKAMSSNHSQHCNKKKSRERWTTSVKIPAFWMLS
jgi:hypothetical protein